MGENPRNFNGLQGVLGHLRQTEKKFLVVDEVPFGDLEFIQGGASESERPVEEYGDAWLRGDTLPPLDAILTDEAKAFVWDGNTRAEGIQAKGGTAHSVRFVRGTRLDAVMKASGANDANGRRRTNADKRSAARLLLSQPELRGYSSNFLAKIAKVSPQVVESVREEMDAEAIARGLAPVTPARRTVKRGNQVFSTKNKAERKQAKAPADPVQRVVDRVLALTEKFDAGQRTLLAERLSTVLQAPAVEGEA